MAISGSPQDRDINTCHGKVSHTWKADTSFELPGTDIVTFAFERISSYDADKPIFISANDPSKYFTAQASRQIVDLLARGLRQRGLNTGDCVSIHSYNNILYPLFWLGVIAAGGRVCASNPAYTTTELIHHFNITNAKFILAHTDCVSTALEAISECDLDSSNIFLFDNEDFHFVQKLPYKLKGTTYQSWKSLLSHGGTYIEQQPTDNQPVKDNIAVYSITSGTTGLPKAAAIPHHYLVSQAMNLERKYEQRTSEVSQLVCLPVFHAFAAQLALILPLRLGISTYLMPRFKIADYIRMVGAFSITDIAVVPPIVSALLHLEPSQYSQLQSLRYIICAGAPMNPELQTRLYQHLSPDLVVGQCWGATELGWITLFDHLEKDTSGSVGRLLPNTELKIIGEDGTTVTQEGQRGEAYIRSPSMFTGYRQNPAANAKAFDSQGFFDTGDIVSIQGGKIYIQGRSKDIMKVNGWQVSPEELESIMMQHPMIADCAVIGRIEKNEFGLEEVLPSAYIVRKSCSKLSEDDVKLYVATKVVTYKRLTGGVTFVSEIPRSPTGKILRRLLVKSERITDKSA